MFGIKRISFLLYKKVIWRIINRNNYTVASNLFNFSSVSVGNYTYGQLNVIDSNPISKLRIGNYCSIAPNVIFILNSDHYTKNISSFPFKVMCLGDSNPEAISHGNIVVDDDVWIGYGVIILSGVHIGQGAVIGAGAVVTKDVPPYSIVGGVPAKIINYRFSNEKIDYFMSLDYSSLTIDLIHEHVDTLYRKVDNLNLDDLKKVFEWFPKKNTN